MLECKEVQEMGSFAYFGPDVEVKWIYPQVIIMQKPATVYLLIKQGLIIEKFCFKDWILIFSADVIYTSM